MRTKDELFREALRHIAARRQQTIGGKSEGCCVSTD